MILPIAILLGIGLLFYLSWLFGIKGVKPAKGKLRWYEMKSDRNEGSFPGEGAIILILIFVALPLCCATFISLNMKTNHTNIEQGGTQGVCDICGGKFTEEGNPFNLIAPVKNWEEINGKRVCTKCAGLYRMKLVQEYKSNP